MADSLQIEDTTFPKGGRLVKLLDSRDDQRVRIGVHC